jgi:hypothetical protein
VLDTCTYIDLGVLDPDVHPTIPEITAVTPAELHQGVAMARNSAVRAARTELLGSAIVNFDPLPFDRSCGSVRHAGRADRRGRS